MGGAKGTNLSRSRYFSFVPPWVVLLISCGSLWAHAQRFAFEVFDQHSGLKNVDPMYLLQDHSGFLWIGTMNGVYRFDGYRFDPAVIRNPGDNSMITGLAEDGRGRVWFSSSDSLGYFEGLEGKELQAPEGGFSFDLANRLSPDPDSPDGVYFVSHHRLYEALAAANQPPRIQPVLTEMEINHHAELAYIEGALVASSHKFWLGCGTAICAFQGKSLRIYASEAGVPSDAWRSFFVDGHGVLWARSDHHILALPNDQAEKFVPMDKNLPRSMLSVRQPQTIEDHQGRVLVNLANGLARFESGQWTVFREGDDLPSHVIRALLVDQQGSVWLALDGGGVARWLGYDQFENYTANRGLSGSRTTWNFLRDSRGDLWIATEDGLRRMRKGSNLIGLPPGGNLAALRRIQSLALVRNGHLWSGSDNGKVIDFNPATGVSSIEGQFGGGIFQVFSANESQVWACTMNGLFLLDDRSDLHRSREPLIRGHVYEGLRDPSGDTWFIADSGLYRVSNGVWTHVQTPANYRPTFSAQISRAPDGTFWISGSPPVIMHIRVEGNTARELGHVDAPPLSSRSVVLVAHDRRGWLWVGGDDGIDVYNGSRWRHLDTDDGLVSNDIDSSAFLDDLDGTIWIGTSGGISHVLHPETIFSQGGPKLHVGPVVIGNAVLLPGQVTRVPWGHRPLTANLSTLDFARAGRTTFRYRIEGLEEDWQDSPKHELRYPPLEPGNYRLQVVAIDAPDNLRSPVVSVAFIITPPWWRSVPVRMGEVLAGILVLFTVWRWGARRQIARERQLQALVRQRTQELEEEKAELLRARAALQIQANHDPLTGILNHGAILRALTLAMERCAREHSPLGVVLADLDHFKRINDAYGHLTGDFVLREYATRIQSAVRPYDEVGRYGGEELLIVLPGFDLVSAARRLQELHRAISNEPIECKGEAITVTCSFGFTWFRPGTDTLESIIDRADSAMYAAKQGGRNRVVLSDAFPT